ncbi:MAG TPA: hypothetical protein DCL48_02595, partial [Alphaproteobacteria bacterium]|nr:hypothetical protein [Alphaproteobacteria bacterium]
EAALDEIVRQMIAEMDAAWDGPTQDVGAFIDSAAQFLPIDAEGLQGWRIWFAFWGRAIVDERLRAKHRAYYATFAARTDEALRAAFPGLTRATARSLADAIIAAIDGLGVRATLEPDAWPPKRQRAALRLLLDPMLTHATRGE